MRVCIFFQRHAYFSNQSTLKTSVISFFILRVNWEQHNFIWSNLVFWGISGWRCYQFISNLLGKKRLIHQKSHVKAKILGVYIFKGVQIIENIDNVWRIRNYTCDKTNLGLTDCIKQNIHHKQLYVFSIH